MPSSKDYGFVFIADKEKTKLSLKRNTFVLVETQGHLSFLFSKEYNQ